MRKDWANHERKFEQEKEKLMSKMAKRTAEQRSEVLAGRGIAVEEEGKESVRVPTSCCADMFFAPSSLSISNRRRRFTRISCWSAARSAVRWAVG